MLKRVKKLIKKSSTTENINKEKDTNNIKMNFESLCRGENVYKKFKIPLVWTKIDLLY